MTAFTRLIATVLGVPDAAVTDDLGPATHSSWTSIKHLELIIAIEENYDMSFSRPEIRSVRSVGDLRKSILNRGLAP
jgi:acyl carrier protein